MQTLIIENAPDRAAAILEIVDVLRTGCEVIRPYLGEKHSIDLDMFDRMIISGGPGNARDLISQDYYQPTLRLIEAFMGIGKPILGICLGHQTLTLLLDGEVETTTQRSGWINIDLTDTGVDNPLFEGCRRVFPVFHYNHDEVTKLAHGAELIATSKQCQVEAFAIPGNKIWGFQSHPEISPKWGAQILVKRIPHLHLEREMPRVHDPSCLRIFENFYKV